MQQPDDLLIELLALDLNNAANYERYYEALNRKRVLFDLARRALEAEHAYRALIGANIIPDAFQRAFEEKL